MLFNPVPPKFTGKLGIELNKLFTSVTTIWLALVPVVFKFVNAPVCGLIEPIGVF